MLSTFALSALVPPALVLAAIDVNLDDKESIKAAAKLVAADMMTFYHGNEPGMVPGILPGPPPDGDYYWWQGGAMWGALLDYWHLTGNDEWNDDIYQSLIHQAGDNRDFMDGNWSVSLGNDDQSFWSMSSMIAAEVNFRDPPEDQPQWLALTQAVWNEQASDDRRDDACGMGLRWQIYPTNQGYNYKNTISNGCFFNQGARLARYTNDSNYADWSDRTWDWLVEVGFIDKDYNVWDGAHVDDNCKSITKQPYSYSPAVLLLGAAHMYDHTKDNKWQDRINGLLDRTLEVFFPDGIAYEPVCEATGCTFDAITFKGFVHRWLAAATQLAPFMRAKVMPVLKTSAQAAVAQCTGGDNGRMCGFHWASGQYDGSVTAGNQMSVLGALTSLLVEETEGAPVTNQTGGTSKGDDDAGVETVTVTFDPVTTADKAGAAILTIMLLAGGLCTVGWMVWE